MSATPEPERRRLALMGVEPELPPLDDELELEPEPKPRSAVSVSAGDLQTPDISTALAARVASRRL